MAQILDPFAGVAIVRAMVGSDYFFFVFLVFFVAIPPAELKRERSAEGVATESKEGAKKERRRRRRDSEIPPYNRSSLIV